MTDFAAIDFETANEEPCSVCSVGVVIVRDGEITERFYSLIHPEPDYYQWFCQRMHGLCEEDTYSYDLINHHHALADAEACAYITMKILP